MESSSSRALRSALALPPLHRRILPVPVADALLPLYSSCYGCNSGGTLPSPRWLSSSPEVKPKGFNDYKLPPVNPPDKENPDAPTLRAQWDNAVRLYGRTYSHAWGTAILAGVVLFGVGWWVKGESPLKALSPTGEIKKEETAD